MKLPSFGLLVSDSIKTFQRFPLVILSAVIACYFGILISHIENESNGILQHYWNIVQSCYLAMLLLLALTVYAERKAFNYKTKIIIQVVGVLIAIGYYFLLPNHVLAVHYIRFTLFVILLHLFISFAPFLKAGEVNGFWQYNRILFLRILTTVLYTVVLYLGLSLALLAIEKLFRVDVESKFYFDLWIGLACIFNTWFFLAGFPKDYASLNNKSDCPKGLKIFTQYVLLPIITIYLLILYAYTLKIIFSQQWPVGWVSYLVLGFSVAGILSLLLIHPIRNDENNQWIIVYSRFFYYAIFPLIVLLFFAVQRRIREYGITELRYFVLILALWLLFLATYFSLSKKKNIKLIPQTLCLIALLSSFGPWGAFSISLNSQKSHLNEIARKNKMFVNEKLVPVNNSVSFKDRKQISSIVEYVVSTHGHKNLQSYFNQNLDSVFNDKKKSGKTELSAYDKTTKILDLLNMRYIGRWEQNDEDIANNFFNYSVDDGNKNSIINIDGYSYIIQNYIIRSYGKDDTFDSAKYYFSRDSVLINFNRSKSQISIYSGGDDTACFNLQPFLGDSLKTKINQTQLQLSDMMLKSSGKKYNYLIVIKNISGTKLNGGIQVQYIDALILIGKKK